MSKGERLCSIAILFFAIGACGSAQPNPRQIDGRAPVAPPYSSSPCPQGNEYKDGCSDAAAGLTLFPNTLDSYKSAPPWNVAGVHFAVGVAITGVKGPYLVPPPTGCVLGDTSLTCAGTLTLDGYDFSLHGGTTLVVTGGNVTVRNCLFIVGPNQGALGKIVDVSGAADATFINNEFDGANIPAHLNGDRL